MKTSLEFIYLGFIILLFSAFWAAGLSVYAQINIFEPCTNSTAVNPNVILAGDAYFTSGIDDPSGAGYLRLTKSVRYQAGSVYINQSFSSTTGIVVEFEYWSWGTSSTKADGSSVFLFDGSYGPGTFALGCAGGGLGYSEITTPPYPDVSVNGTGLTGGYIAVGLDEYGNWINKFTVGDSVIPGIIAPNISIRGRTADHTPSLSGILMNTQSFTLEYQTNTSVRPAASQYYRKFQVAILYNASINKYQVSVSVQTSTNGSMQRILNPYTMNSPPPATLKVGLAAGTGYNYSNHEIRNLRISSPGDVRVEKTGEASVANGNTTSYTVTVFNNSPIDLNGVTFKDILPTGFIPDAGTPSFNNGGNAGNTLVSGGYAGNVYDAVLNIKQNDSCSFTFSGKFNVAGDTTVTNTAIVKTPTGYTDTDLSNDTAHFATFVFGTYVMIIHDTICPNTAYTNHGFNILASELQTAGIVERQYTIPNPTGCDSVIVLYLNVIAKDTVYIPATICEGEIYQENGFNVSDSGTHTQNLQNRFGCDSTVILNLYVATKDTIFIPAEICDGEIYSQNGFNESKSGTYYQNLQNIFGCDSLVELHLTVKQTPDIEIIAITDNFCDKDFVEIQLITNGDSFLWNTGSLENPIIVTKSGIYSATAFIKDCEKTAEYTVEECPCELWLPNAFTPNNDGINDSFFPVVHSNLASFSMHIYDRWGQIIYKTDSQTPWDGTINGRFAAAGVYFCVISYSCAYEPTKIHNKQGSITLLR